MSFRSLGSEFKLEPDPNGGIILDPDPNTMYFDKSALYELRNYETLHPSCLEILHGLVDDLLQLDGLVPEAASLVQRTLHHLLLHP